MSIHSNNKASSIALILINENYLIYLLLYFGKIELTHASKTSSYFDKSRLLT